MGELGEARAGEVLTVLVRCLSSREAHGGQVLSGSCLAHPDNTHGTTISEHALVVASGHAAHPTARKIHERLVCSCRSKAKSFSKEPENDATLY